MMVSMVVQATEKSDTHWTSGASSQQVTKTSVFHPSVNARRWRTTLKLEFQAKLFGLVDGEHL